MNGEESAFAALGLRSGAGRAEVDEAYRRLIKRYHPDRTGGDGSRAAEINRAYTMLRRKIPQPARARRSVPVPIQRRSRPRQRRRAGWMLVGVLVIGAGIGIANDVPRRGGPDYSAPFEWATPAYRPTTSTAVSPLTDFEEPLQTAVIDRAVADALQFSEDGDSAGSLAFSRACHNSLRQQPSLAWFDACAAFDEATVILAGANPLSDSGPFNSTSVMARQLGAARLLSDDMLAADSRLHQIRSRVELALIPKLDEAASQPL